MQNSYLSVVYNETRTPITGYPDQLVGYLMKRFGLKPGEHILELGCGRGDFISAFKRAGLHCSGVDLEQHNISGVETKKCDLSKDPLPFEDESFDIVYHKSVIEHLYQPNHIMNETCRVLKKGGKLIFLTPDWERQLKIFYEDITHCRPYNVTSIRDTLSMWGLNDVSSEKFYQYPLFWRWPILKFSGALFNPFLSVKLARWFTRKTNKKFFQFSIETMILGYGKK